MVKNVFFGVTVILDHQNLIHSPWSPRGHLRKKVSQGLQVQCDSKPSHLWNCNTQWLEWTLPPGCRSSHLCWLNMSASSVMSILFTKKLHCIVIKLMKWLQWAWINSPINFQSAFHCMCPLSIIRLSVFWLPSKLIPCSTALNWHDKTFSFSNISNFYMENVMFVAQICKGLKTGHIYYMFLHI